MNILNHHPDVIVVGAGIVGAFAAYFLTRSGFKVTIVERAGIGNQASRCNPGGLNPLHGAGIPGPMTDFAMQSFRLHMENQETISELSSIEFKPRIVSRIQLALSSADIAGLGKAKQLYDAAEGFSADWLDRAGLLELEPNLSPDVKSGLLLHGNGVVDAYQYTQAIITAAMALGASLVEGEVNGIIGDAGKIGGVVLNGSELHCGAVVFAIGPWVSQPAEWLNIQIPVEPVKGQLLYAQITGNSGQFDITWGLSGIYQLENDKVILGGTEERVGFNLAVNDSGRKSILKGISRMITNIDDIHIQLQNAAARPVSADQLPIIGKAPGWDNAYILTGAGRKGILYCSGMGYSIAEEISTGRVSLTTEHCSAARFTR